MSNNFYNTMLDIESKGDYTANRPGSAYYGGYQFHKGSADPYLSKIGKTWEDYKKSPDVQNEVVRMETANNKRIMQGWGKDNPSDLDLWTAHNLGIGNARKIHQGNVTDPNLIKAVRNQAGKPQDVAAYMERYGSKFNNGEQAPVIAPPLPGLNEGLVANPTIGGATQKERIANLYAGLGAIQAPNPQPAPRPVAINEDTGLGGLSGFKRQGF